MFPGLVTLCLNTHNLPEMRRFYEALGLQVHIDQPTNVLLNNGNVDIGLMTFLEAPCLNFRGADPFAMHKSMKDQCPTLEGTPAQYEKAQYAADADGASWMTYDPDGNGIFFDTNTLETGAGGAAFALQRVLDGAAKELANVGASDACRTAFRQEVQHRFMPPARRTQTDQKFDSLSLTDPNLYPGDFVFCVKTADLAASRAFYLSLGLAVSGNDDDTWVQMGNADCQLALMTFLGENWLNFRGADPFLVYERLSATGLSPEGEPSRYGGEEFNSAPGAHWQTKDPDGNVVYFDTTDPERIVPGDPTALQAVLQQTRQRLINISAEPTCIDAFETRIVQPFGG